MNEGEVSIYAGWSFPYYPFILLENLKLKGAFREFINADCRNLPGHNYVHFSRPVTEEKSAEQLAQICILWLIPGGSQITDSIWMFKKLKLCWELLPSSLLSVFTELFPWVCWMQLWLLFCLGVWWVYLSSSPKLFIIGSCWDWGLGSNSCMWTCAVPAESCSELGNINLRKQLHSSHSLEGFIREIPSVSWKWSCLCAPAPSSALKSNSCYDL